MKKLLFTLALTFLSIGFGKAQDKFRNDYNLVSFYDYETKTWSDWEHAEHTLVFNYNSNMDIAHFMPNGKALTYRNIGNKEEGYTNGNHYQILNVIDDKGYYLQIQLFDDPSIGMKIILGQSMVQFSKD